MPNRQIKIPHDVLDGFLYHDGEAVLDKLAGFALQGPSNLHVVSDFDLTLTAGQQVGQNVGTWDVMDHLMPEEGVREHARIYQTLRPAELEGRLTTGLAVKAWSETLDLITSYKIPIDELRAAFLAVARLRPGAKELFDACRAGEIPSVILSSGISNIIQIITAHYGIDASYIVANDLIVDTDGRMSSWNPESLVHIRNKNERGHGELSALRQQRPNVLLLGDVPDDVKMVAGDKDVLRVRVLDTRKGESHIPEVALRESFDHGYDLVVEHDLLPAARLVGWLCNC